MKIIPKTNLKIDRDKDAYPAGKVVDIKKDIAQNLIDRGLATLPDDGQTDPVDNSASSLEQKS